MLYEDMIYYIYYIYLRSCFVLQVLSSVIVLKSNIYELEHVAMKTCIMMFHKINSKA